MTADTPPLADRRWPLVPTLLVLLAMAIMVGLGIWQLQRAAQKERLIAAWQHNLTLPATAYPGSNPADQRFLYRTLSANCLRVTGWRTLGGETADGRSGWRHVASCATGAEGPGLLVDMGVSEDADAVMRWAGGPVRGIATTEPDSHSALGRLFLRSPPLRVMIVAETAPPGLVASSRPDPRNVPSNHLSYAVQWFIFAGLAGIIYFIALRRRWAGQ